MVYGFAILRGEWGSLLMGFMLITFISSFLDQYTGKNYFIYTFGILMAIFSLTIWKVNTVRNNSTEKVTLQGEIIDVHNNYNYVHFELKGYPDITFKSYDAKIRSSFKEYVPERYYEEIPVNIGKEAEIIVFKSHLEWCRKPPAQFLHNLRFPLEVEIESFEIIE